MWWQWWRRQLLLPFGRYSVSQGTWTAKKIGMNARTKDSTLFQNYGTAVSKAWGYFLSIRTGVTHEIVCFRYPLFSLRAVESYKLRKFPSCRAISTSKIWFKRTWGLKHKLVASWILDRVSEKKKLDKWGCNKFRDEPPRADGFEQDKGGRSQHGTWCGDVKST